MPEVTQTSIKNELFNLNTQQLEDLWMLIQKEMAVLVDQQSEVNDSIARLQRNLSVIEALLDLQRIKEQQKDEAVK